MNFCPEEHRDPRAGTLEMTKVATRGDAARRARGRCRASGNSPSPCSSASPPPALLVASNAAVSARIASRRARGLVHVHRQRDEDEGDAVAHQVLARRGGTPARSPSAARAPRDAAARSRAAHRRRPRADALSETPRTSLTASRSAIGSECPTSVRRGPIGSLRNDDGAGRAMSSPTAIAARRASRRGGRASPSPRAARRARATGRCRCRRACRPRAARRPGPPPLLRCPPARAARAPPGRGRAAAARPPACDRRRPARGGSSSGARRSRPRGEGARWISHSGCMRSSRARAPRQRARRSGSARAARSSATTWRGCRSAGVDPHGAREPPGREGEALAEAGGRVRRGATCACTRSSVIAGRAGSGRKRPRHATCMCALPVSACRKEASSGVRRSAMTAHGGAGGREGTWPGGRRSGAPVSPCWQAGRGCARAGTP